MHRDGRTEEKRRGAGASDSIIQKAVKYRDRIIIRALTVMFDLEQEGVHL